MKYVYLETRCLMCVTGAGRNQCGIILHVRNNTIQEVKPNKDDPASKGVICAKPLALKYWVHHPDRIKNPLLRDGSSWKKISWEDALDIISGRLEQLREKFGPESVAFSIGTARGIWYNLFQRFVHAFGSPNWISPGMAQCFYPRVTATALTLGGRGKLAFEWPDFKNSKCILLWGTNPAATFKRRAVEIIQAKSKGAKLITVDPELTYLASKSDLWLQLRPGTDCALALGMLHVIIRDGLYDTEFVDKWCYGFDKLAERVKDYPPEKVSEITWVPADKISEAAEIYAKNKPACISWCCAIEQQIDTIQTCRAICLLSAVTGNVDIPGGNIFPGRVGIIDLWSKEFTLADQLPDRILRKRLGIANYPLLCDPKHSLVLPGAHPPSVWKAILTQEPYPIKAMWIQGNNAVLAYANSSQVIKALQSLEFLVVIDLFMTETAKLANIVLPACSWLEKNSLAEVFDGYDSYLFPCPKAIEPLHESRPDEEIMFDVANRLGFGHKLWKNLDEFLDYLLRPLGIGFEELKQRKYIKVSTTPRKFEQLGFDTPTGKVELYSTTLEKLGYDPLPFYTEPPESPLSTPELAKEYPLILTTGGRSPLWFHTEYRQISWFREIEPRPYVHIHPETAQAMNISEGDLVIIETSRGRIKRYARLTPGIHPRVIQPEYGWGEDANVNYLTDYDKCSPGIGSYVLKGLLCRLRKYST